MPYITPDDDFINPHRISKISPNPKIITPEFFYIYAEIDYKALLHYVLSELPLALKLIASVGSLQLNEHGLAGHLASILHSLSYYIHRKLLYKTPFLFYLSRYYNDI